MSMLCYQCEQTAKGTGCTVKGVCGKEPEVAALQDLIVYATKGVAMYAHRVSGIATQTGRRKRGDADGRHRRQDGVQARLLDLG